MDIVHLLCISTPWVIRIHPDILLKLHLIQIRNPQNITPQSLKVTSSKGVCFLNYRLDFHIIPFYISDLLILNDSTVFLLIKYLH